MPCTCKPAGGVHEWSCVMSAHRLAESGQRFSVADDGSIRDVEAEYNAHMADMTTAAKMLDAMEHGLVRKDPRPTWHEWALNVASVVATRADCTRRQVGAVILDEEHRIISTGYNGYPTDRPGCLSAGACPRGQTSYAEIPKDSAYVGVSIVCEAIHAEENAILYARKDLRGSTLYSTQKPCPNCQRFIAGAGIDLVVWPGATDGSPVDIWYPRNGPLG